ncbi:MAG TPA: DNA topoisomerase, partial [Casimicrobiaceae bacterium]|nr:DNA topoisomerase [Casimicrobiaceae bacterium]
VHGAFGASGGEYAGRWFDEAFRKSEDDPDARAERLWEQARALAIVEKCTGQPGEVSEESKPSTQGAPLLYDLTSLQREANGRFGFSARTTLSLAQALYEKHKALTYPRTDSRALPEDYVATVKSTMEALGESNAYGGFARKVLREKWVRPNKRIFDNAKISDHFAIIPTLVAPKHLNELEAKLYDFVVKRFLAAFYPPAEYMVTTRITRVAGEPFKSEGKVLVNPGWLAVYGREAQEEQGTLAKVEPGEKVATEKVEAVLNTTRPPARFTEATLLSAMEGAGKLIEDEDLREAMREKGLGTPATRAQIIEGLLQEKYILREGKELIPTPKAFSLVALLKGLGVPELFSPELTAEWEFKLNQMEHGKLKRDTFMREIVDMTNHIVLQAKNHESDTIPGDFATLSVPCPKCGGEVHEKYKKFQCQQCDFGFWKIMGGRQLSADEAQTLLRERTVGPLEGFRSRMGKPFTATIKLSDENEVSFDFGDKADDDREAPDFSGQETLGPCPKCGSGVYEMPQAYVCEKAVGPDRTCDFRSGRVILQRPIERTQMHKLLADGKTDLLQFVSARTRRPFSAFLKREASGKIGFEFEAKDGKSKGSRPARGSSALRVLGMHPRDKKPVELHAGRYGPYVKHGAVNATVADRDRVDALTLDDALMLLAAKAGRSAGGEAMTARSARRAAPAGAAAKSVLRPKTEAAAPATRGKTAAKTVAGKTTTRSATKPAGKTATKSRASAKTTARSKRK